MVFQQVTKNVGFPNCATKFGIPIQSCLEFGAVVQSRCFLQWLLRIGSGLEGAEVLVCQKQISLSECQQGFHADAGADVFGFVSHVERGQACLGLVEFRFPGVADFASFVHCFLSMSVVQHICGVGFVQQVFYKCSVGSVVFSGFFTADVFFRFRWSQFGVS